MAWSKPSSSPAPPAAETASAYRSACVPTSGGSRSGCSAVCDSVAREPALPIKTDNSAVPAHNPRAVIGVTGPAGTVAVAPIAKMKKNGPAGRRRSTSAITEPAVANATSTTTSIHALVCSQESVTPRATPAQSSRPAWIWCRVRSQPDSPRP
ncbi:Uncharacterised protein [Mycobacteroides abscessus subsp. abscessus]|nr:Uncharacterised protein [Mycobacteroides abscessus subsp. abscessus]